VLRGEGRGFSAGAEVREHLPESVRALFQEFHAAVAAIVESPCPVIAQVHGPCLGGGLEVALAADLVYAADDATLGQPEIQLGVFPPFAAAAYPARFGRLRAAEIVLLGETLRAAEAYDRGLLTAVVPAAGLAAKVDAVASRLASFSPDSLRIARRALRLGDRGSLAAFQDAEALYLDELAARPDAVEGIRAFLEKRPPRWRRG
jgi:cyclohexa-1,5-dienecarbonyl-CoA hydratase